VIAQNYRWDDRHLCRPKWLETQRASGKTQSRDTRETNLQFRPSFPKGKPLPHADKCSSIARCVFTVVGGRPVHVGS